MNIDNLHYQTGFGNYFSSEAIPLSLPLGQNSPKNLPHGLIAEQVNNSAFTALPEYNKKLWLYKKHPSVTQGPYEKASLPFAESQDETPSPNPLRWDPELISSTPHDFLEGLKKFVSNEGDDFGRGCTNYLYTTNKKMNHSVFKNSDGEILVIPQKGNVIVQTEVGKFTLSPLEILVIPRALLFKLDPLENEASGYLCENHGLPFQLPNRGPIGANGLANERDFKYPVACFEDEIKQYTLFQKFNGHFWKTNLDKTPFDVVAWHGNNLPYKYNLLDFNVINTVSFDHPDPSIFTVLTSPSSTPGVANIDFVIFPPRWMVAEKTFRPPYFHRNNMSEFMGLIQGEYDAKPGKGFQPGGASLHNAFVPHGPSKEAYDKEIKAQEVPVKLSKTMAFMLESKYLYRPSAYALNGGKLQEDYYCCWEGL